VRAVAKQENVSGYHSQRKDVLEICVFIVFIGRAIVSTTGMGWDGMARHGMRQDDGDGGRDGYGDGDH
jgi:hypothetical protein